MKIIKVKPRARPVSEDVNLGCNFSTEGVDCFCNKYKGKRKYVCVCFKGTSLGGNNVAITFLLFFQGILLMEMPQPPLQLEVVM